MECALSQAKYIGNAEMPSNIRLNNHRNDLSNPWFLPLDLYSRKLGHFFLQAKLFLIKLLYNIQNEKRKSHVKVITEDL